MIGILSPGLPDLVYLYIGHENMKKLKYYFIIQADRISQFDEFFFLFCVEMFRGDTLLFKVLLL